MDGSLTGRLNRDGIRIHDPEDFEGMRRAGALAADILDRIAPHVAPDVFTLDLNGLIEDMIREAGATSATVGYKGYRHASCISINNVVCHGIPSRERTAGAPSPKLRDGDILNIDVTVIVDGWFGDTSRMYVAGTPNRKAERLIDITYESPWPVMRSPSWRSTPAISGCSSSAGELPVLRPEISPSRRRQ